MFNALDWVIIAIIGLSTVFGFFVGFIRSILSVLVWVGATVVSMVMGPALAQSFSAFTSSPSIQLWLSYGVVFLVSLLAGWVIKLVVGLIMVNPRGVGGMDSMLGAVFGFIRGILVVVVLLWFAVLCGVDQTPLYQTATLARVFSGMVSFFASMFPGASAALHSSLSSLQSTGQGMMSSAGGYMGPAAAGSSSSGSSLTSGLSGGAGGMGDTMNSAISSAQNLASQATAAVKANLGGLSGGQ